MEPKFVGSLQLTICECDRLQETIRRLSACAYVCVPSGLSRIIPSPPRPAAHFSLRAHPSCFANGFHSPTFTAACAISPPTALRLRRHHHTANTLRFASVLPERRSSSYRNRGLRLCPFSLGNNTCFVSTYWEVSYERIVKLTRYSTSYTKFLQGIPIRFIQIRLDEDELSLASAIESSDGLNR